MKKVYELVIDGVTFPLRLTLDGQKKIAAKFKGDTLRTMMEAIDDPEKMEAVLDAALHYHGSPTPANVKASSIYDMMVDAGFAGQEDFGNVIMGIAVASGLLKQEKADKLMEYLQEPPEGDVKPDEENPQ